MRLATLVALLCLALPAPVRAQRAGLLLGLASDSGTAYRTLWIAPANGRVSVAAQLHGIVVPRDSGFWVVDVRRECAADVRAPEIVADTTEPVDSMRFIDEEDVVLRYRLGEAAPPPENARSSCAEVARAVVGEREVDVGDHCFISHTRLTHVSPKVIATSGVAIETEFCEPARYTSRSMYDVVDWDDRHVTLLDRLPAARARALEAQFEREKGDCASQDSPDEAWGIERATGMWRAVFQTYGPTVCRGESEGEVTATVPLPPSLARRDDAAKWLPALRKAHGRVTDVFTSPGRDLVAARVGDRLLVHAVTGTTLGPTALEVHLKKGEAVVMAEWALGAHVDRWTQELAR